MIDTLRFLNKSIGHDVSEDIVCMLEHRDDRFDYFEVSLIGTTKDLFVFLSQSRKIIKESIHLIRGPRRSVFQFLPLQKHFHFNFILII